MSERPRGREPWPSETLRPDEDSWDDETDEDEASSLLDIALALAAAGLPVFPCNADKRPAIPKAKGGNGFHDASTDPDRIRELWELAGPAAQLIGVPTGGASGFDVLDFDPRHGSDNWRAANIHRLPETRIHGTPGLPKAPIDPVMPGEHWLFRHVDGVRNIQDGQSIAPGIDVRGSGGYIIMPPSTGYAVIHEADIAPWPDWLLPLVIKVAEPPPRPDPNSYATPAKVSDNRLRGFIDREVRRVRDAPQGGRHGARLAAARSIGGVADEAVLSDREVEEMLIAARPPEIEEEKERRTIRDGLAYGRAAPIDLNTLPDSALFRGYRPHRGNGVAPPPQPGGGGAPPPSPDEPEPDPDPEPDEEVPLPDEPLGDAALPDLFVMKADLPLVSQNLRNRLASHPWLFERGGPARLVSFPSEQDRQAEVHQLSSDAVVHAAHEVCRPYQINWRGKRSNVTLPERVAKLYLALNGRWNLRPLHGVCCSALLDPDGGIHSHEGYHAPTGMWCTRTPPLSVPARPFNDQAMDALYRLRAAMRTFTFKGSPLVERDGNLVVDIEQQPGLCESAALCGLLTAACRASLPLAPGVMINAPSLSGSGAGKGLLARMMIAIGLGIVVEATAAGHDEAEFEKRISTALLSGDPAVLLDNLNNTLLRSAQLESCLTEPLVGVRLFGHLKKQMVRAIMFVVLTGNGLQASGDAARRYVYPTLEPPVDNPEQRKYPPGFLEDIIARRGELLSDCLTIWRWGRQQSHLKRGLPFGSYERWTAWVRDPLLALGCDDPVKGVKQARAQDSARVNLSALFVKWREYHVDARVKADDLDWHVRRLVDDKERVPAIRQKLALLADTRLDGFKLESKVEGNAANRVSPYRVVAVEGDAEEPDGALGASQAPKS